jgi:hypothetical protein
MKGLDLVKNMREQREIIEKALSKMRGRATEIRQLGAIRYAIYANKFGYYTCQDGDKLEIVLGDESFDSEPIEFDVDSVDDIQETEFINDSSVILHINGFELLLATA